MKITYKTLLIGVATVLFMGGCHSNASKAPVESSVAKDTIANVQLYDLQRNTTNLYDEISKNKLTVIDFWASWCGPCRMVSPIVDEIAEERTDIKVGKVNVDEEPELASAFRIDSIPTVIIIKDKTVKAISLGYKPESALTALIDKEL